MPVPWMPVVTTSRNPRVCSCCRSGPRRRSMPPMPAPFTPWQLAHIEPYTRAPAATRPLQRTRVLLGSRVIRDEARETCASPRSVRGQVASSRPLRPQFSRSAMDRQSNSNDCMTEREIRRSETRR